MMSTVSVRTLRGIVGLVAVAVVVAGSSVALAQQGTRDRNSFSSQREAYERQAERYGETRQTAREAEQQFQRERTEENKDELVGAIESQLAEFIQLMIERYALMAEWVRSTGLEDELSSNLADIEFRIGQLEGYLNTLNTTDDPAEIRAIREEATFFRRHIFRQSMARLMTDRVFVAISKLRTVASSLEERLDDAGAAAAGDLIDNEFEALMEEAEQKHAEAVSKAEGIRPADADEAKALFGEVRSLMIETLGILREARGVLLEAIRLLREGAVHPCPQGVRPDSETGECPPATPPTMSIAVPPPPAPVGKPDIPPPGYTNGNAGGVDELPTPPPASVGRGNQSIGAVGCSNTGQAVEGHYSVAASEGVTPYLWPVTRRGEFGYGGGGVTDWAEQADVPPGEQGGGFWRKFDELKSEYGISGLWINLCIRPDEVGVVKDAEFQGMISDIVDRAFSEWDGSRWVVDTGLHNRTPVWVSPLNVYGEGLRPTLDGAVATSFRLKDWAVSQEIANAGPTLGPLQEDDLLPGDVHLSEEGQLLVGEQLLEFFQ